MLLKSPAAYDPVSYSLLNFFTVQLLPSRFLSYFSPVVIIFVSSFSASVTTSLPLLIALMTAEI